MDVTHSEEESEKSVTRSLVEEEIAEIDRHVDQGATLALRSGRADLLEEVTTHLRELADFLEEDVGERIEDGE